MPKTAASQKLMELLRPFEGRMIMPTRLTPTDLQYLDHMTFDDLFECPKYRYRSFFQKTH